MVTGKLLTFPNKTVVSRRDGISDLHILVVDDDIVDRESIKRSLLASACKHSIDEAASVDAAIEMCSKQYFNVILLDCQFPQRDGIEFLFTLRTKNNVHSETIIMMSHSEDETLALKCLHAGAQDFLLKKEISGAKLRRTIMQAQKRFELEKELRESFQRVKYLAERDALTSLANRHLFDEAFKVAVANNQRDLTKLALLVFDIDNFKLVNDTFGHSTGDKLLQEACKRILAVLRENELFARLGGDEFAIMLTNLNSPHDAVRMADRIRLCLKKAFNIGGHEIVASVSIGISMCEAGGDLSAEKLLTYADIAMYRSKRKGRGEISFFEEGMQDRAQQLLTLENGLSMAMERQEFYLYYQPVFQAQTLKLVGFESLIRWKSPQGMVPPDIFIPVAEQTQHIMAIGRWVIAEAISQLGIWNRERAEPMCMAINISAKQLADTELPAFINALCEQHNVAPHLLEFELTETALLENVSARIAVLEGIVGLNCTLALDDFGTGYSSIAHLQNTPLNTVKLDKSLMPTANGQQKATALLNGLVQMLKALNLTIVAEGVEIQTHERLCQTLEVDRLQGFHYSVALPAHEISRQYLT